MHDEYYGVPSTPTSDFLAHYGVLGMKWGIRRAAKKGTEYSYQSHATKKYKKAAAKLLAKSQKAAEKGNSEKSAKLKTKSAVMANRAKRSAEVDKGEEDYARSISTKKALGLAALVGTGTLKAYAQHRAMSGVKNDKKSSPEDKAKKLTAGVEAWYNGTLGSRTRKAGYIRQDENRKGLNAIGHRNMEIARGTGLRTAAIGAHAISNAARSYDRSVNSQQRKRKRSTARA